MNAYEIPAETLDAELEIKKSRFIARAGYIRSKEAMKGLLELMQQDYPDARHYCWAYQIGDPTCAVTAAMNDAGEPSGTAGKPILNVIQHKKLGDVFVIVARYFGGIKLGAGGLVRAYSGATEQVLAKIQRISQSPMLSYELTMPFAKEQLVRHILSTESARITGVTYVEEVKLIAELSLQDVEKILPALESNLIKCRILK